LPHKKSLRGSFTSPALFYSRTYVLAKSEFNLAQGSPEFIEGPIEKKPAFLLGLKAGTPV
jgi:hypothetical protein